MTNDTKTLSRWFAETANWFVVFVRTGDEQKITSRLQAKLDSEIYNVFIPTRDFAFTRNKITTMIRKPLFHGYVFIAAMVEAEKCLKTIEPLFYNDPKIYALLSNDGTVENAQLTAKDKALMSAILDEDFNMSALEAVVEGDWVKVNMDAFAGTDAEVIRVNKRKQTAEIGVTFGGQKVDCEIALELLVPINRVKNIVVKKGIS